MISLTENYINNHRNEIIIPFMLMNENKKDELYEKCEKIVSNDLEHFINDDNLLLLHVSTIHRILTEYQMKNNNHTKREIIEFLFKYFRKHKRSASVLFEKIDFSNENKEFLQKIFSDDEISSNFDFHFINTEYHKSVYDLHNEILRNENLMKIEKDEIKNENKQLKIKIQQQSDELNQKINDLTEIVNQMRHLIDEQRNEINELKKPHLSCLFLDKKIHKEFYLI